MVAERQENRQRSEVNSSIWLVGFKWTTPARRSFAFPQSVSPQRTRYSIQMSTDVPKRAHSLHYNNHRTTLTRITQMMSLSNTTVSLIIPWVNNYENMNFEPNSNDVFVIKQWQWKLDCRHTTGPLHSNVNFTGLNHMFE